MTKSEISRINETIRNLKIEEKEAKSLGPAAVACVREVRKMWEKQLKKAR